MKRILKTLKTIRDKKNKKIQKPNIVKVYSEDDAIYLDINGLPFSVEIVYKGSIYLESNLGLLFRINYASNKITIINTFATSLPKKLFKYEGDIEILDCQIMTYDGEIIKANIKNNNRQTLIQVQETNVEDDTLIIREELPLRKRAIMTGKKPVNIPNRNIEKLDKEQLLTIIPKLSEYRKRRVSEPVVRTTTTTPIKKVIKKTPTIKGGKY